MKRFGSKTVLPALLTLVSLGAGQEVEAPAAMASRLLGEGVAAYQKGEKEAAVERLREAKAASEAGPAESKVRYEVLKTLAAVQASQGDYEGAEASLERAMDWRERYERATLLDLSGDRLEMAAVLEWRKEYERALAVLNSVATQYILDSKNTFDTRLADVYSRQAHILSASGDKAGAVQMSERAVRVRSLQFGDWHMWLTPELERLGVYALQARDYEKAEEAYRMAVLIRERWQGRDHIDLVSPLDGLGWALFGEKKHEEAEKVYMRLIRMWRDSAGMEHPMVVLTLDKLAALYRDWGREGEGEAAEAQAVALRTLFHANGLFRKGGELVRQKRLREALEVYRKALGLLDKERPEHTETVKKLEALISEMTPKRPAGKKAGPAKGTG